MMFQRLLSLTAFSAVTIMQPVTAFAAGSAAVRPFWKTAFLRMAAPGVVVAPQDKVREALQNPATTVVDARTIEEIQKDGYFTGCADSGGKLLCHWVHAPSTKTESPLLQIASASLIPDLEAPVVVYCASGIRAGTVKTELERQGYKTVLNAGGLSDLDFLKK